MQMRLLLLMQMQLLLLLLLLLRQPMSLTAARAPLRRLSGLLPHPHPHEDLVSSPVCGCVSST